MREYHITLHNLEETVRFVFYMEKYNLHGTLSCHNRSCNARSFMGIVADGFIARQVTLRITEEDVNHMVMNKFHKKINAVYKNGTLKVV